MRITDLIRVNLSPGEKEHFKFQKRHLHHEKSLNFANKLKGEGRFNHMGSKGEALTVICLAQEPEMSITTLRSRKKYLGNRIPETCL